MTSKIRILIADDHTLLRNGICALLEDEQDMVIVGEADDGREAVRLAGQLKPHVVLMDIAMPLLNGLEATRQIKCEHPEINVLVLTMYDHEEYFREMLEVGASGYIIKRAAATELVSAISIEKRMTQMPFPLVRGRYYSSSQRARPAGRLLKS